MSQTVNPRAIPRVAPGFARQWLQCRTCRAVSYRDYQPYSLSNPVITLACGHSIGTGRDFGCDVISESDALEILEAQRPKTRDDVDALKRGWHRDPCWDLEDTPGYEKYRDDLLAYREQSEREWEAADLKRRQEYAARLGIPDNLTLADYVAGLERQLGELKAALDRHENEGGHR